MDKKEDEKKRGKTKKEEKFTSCSFSCKHISAKECLFSDCFSFTRRSQVRKPGLRTPISTSPALGTGSTLLLNNQTPVSHSHTSTQRMHTLDRARSPAPPQCVQQTTRMHANPKYFMHTVTRTLEANNCCSAGAVDILSGCTTVITLLKKGKNHRHTQQQQQQQQRPKKVIRVSHTCSQPLCATITLSCFGFLRHEGVVPIRFLDGRRLHEFLHVRRGPSFNPKRF